MLNTQDDTCAVSAILMELPGEIDTTGVRERTRNIADRSFRTSDTYLQLPPPNHKPKAGYSRFYVLEFCQISDIHFNFPR